MFRTSTIPDTNLIYLFKILRIFLAFSTQSVILEIFNLEDLGRLDPRYVINVRINSRLYIHNSKE